MNKEKKSQRSFVNIGSASLLVIFLTLCLSSFSILSLASATSDFSFSRRFAENKAEYYEASSTAQSVVAQIDSMMQETADRLLSDGKSGKEFRKSYEDSLLQLLNGAQIESTDISAETVDGTLYIFWQTPLDDTKALSVRLKVTDPLKDGVCYEIVSWQKISTAEWEGDNSLHLMTMN